MKSFLTRLTSGIVLVALILVVCILGGWRLWLFTAYIGLVGLHEFYRVFEIRGWNPLRIVGIAGSLLYLGALSEYVKLPVNASFFVLILTFMAIMGIYVFGYPKFDSTKIMASYFGIIYVPVMLGFIYQTRMLDKGFYLVWLIFLCSWGCDTCAYCTGMLLGKHKLAPVLSPKKSVEGAVGGVVGAALLGGIYAAVMSGVYTVELPVLGCAGICAAGAVASQVGDLAASAIKRQHGIKDYGTLIPGHGGILDRFDSVIVTAPIIYILATFVG